MNMKMANHHDFCCFIVFTHHIPGEMVTTFQLIFLNIFQWKMCLVFWFKFGTRQTMMTSSNGSIFCVAGCWPFVRGIYRSPVNSPHKSQWHGALMFFDLRLNKRFNKQSWGWWFETPPRSLWRHCNATRSYPMPGHFNQWRHLAKQEYVSLTGFPSQSQFVLISPAFLVIVIVFAHGTTAMPS